MTSETMTIMQVLPELVTGGVERGTLDISRALIEAGHKAIVVSNGGPMVSELVAMGAQHIELPVHSKNPFAIWHNASRLEALIRSLNVDLIHARSRAPAWSCFWASGRTKIPYLTTFHGTYGHQNGFKRWYNKIMCRGPKTIAVSEFISNHIQSVYGIPSAQIEVVHRGIDMELFERDKVPCRELAQLKQQWNISPEKTIILLPGRLTRWKGQIDFIEAIATLGRKDIQCLIVGSDQGRDAYSNELLQLVKQHQLQDQVQLCGHKSDIATAYALSDIVVSASREPEAFGRVTCEAQAMGCIVIATQHGGAQETVAPEQQTWQCSPNDVASLSKSIERALSIPSEQKQAIGEASRAFIDERFSLNRMCSDTLAIYESLLK